MPALPGKKSAPLTGRNATKQDLTLFPSALKQVGKHLAKLEEIQSCNAAEKELEREREQGREMD